jgi:membrane associated rhomboid family serine protease
LRKISFLSFFSTVPNPNSGFDSGQQTHWLYPFVKLNFAIYILHGAGRLFGWKLFWPYSSFGVFVSRTYFAKWWTWFTSAITHTNFLHLAVNMFCMSTFVTHIRCGHVHGQTVIQKNCVQNPYPSIDVISWFVTGALWCGAFCVPFGYCVAKKVPYYAVGASGGAFGIIAGHALTEWMRYGCTPFAIELPEPLKELVPQLVPFFDRVQFDLIKGAAFLAAISLLLSLNQLRTGRGLISHIGHFGGMAGGAWAAFANDKIFKNLDKPRNPYGYFGRYKQRRVPSKSRWIF